MIDTSPVKGCIILKPYGFTIWDNIKEYLDREIKRHTKAANVYFPLLVPTSLLAKEAEHVDGFAKECAVVTHHRLRTVSPSSSSSTTTPTTLLEPDPGARLTEPLVIRPTSEAIIWNSFSSWVQSYRDLPLIINQWVNVFRWELRTRPFLRTSEFLWQEGHTVHSTEKEAYQLSLTMLEVYQKLLKDYLAIPVIVGKKSPSEKFAGADETFTCEVLCQNGWALQSATSHYLGTHFSKAFKVMYTLPSSSSSSSSGEPTNTNTTTKEYGYGTSWGSSTRLIGAIIQSHSDDIGLVLPPTIAPIQIVIVGIFGGGSSKKNVTSTPNTTTTTTTINKSDIIQYCEKLQKTLEPHFRVAIDTDLDTPPGSRYYTWERKGVPLRFEIGYKEVQNRTVSIKDRSNNERYTYSLGEDTILINTIQSLLEQYHQNLYQRALKRTEQTINRDCTQYQDLKQYAIEQNQKYANIDDHYEDNIIDNNPTPTATPAVMNASSIGIHSVTPKKTKNNKRTTSTSSSNSSRSTTYADYTPLYQAYLVPWNENKEAEQIIKQETKYTLRCYPLNEQEGIKDKVCFYSGKPATHMALFAKAF